MGTTFNSNPSTTTISCYSPTNASDEKDLDTFYNEICSLVRNTPQNTTFLSS